MAAEPQDQAPGSGLLVALVFFALAAWFAYGPELDPLPETVPVYVADEDLSTSPARAVLGEPPMSRINEFDRTCMECHRTFQPLRNRRTERIQHTHIVMDHGSMTDCYVCHATANHNRVVLANDEIGPFTAVDQLCARCHQSLVRDWHTGSHGRTNGFWDAELGPVRRLVCTECHDPHQPRTPAMDPIAPLPPPNTWRMGKPLDHHSSGEHKRDPLREALERAANHNRKQRKD